MEEGGGGPVSDARRMAAVNSLYVAAASTAASAAALQWWAGSLLDGDADAAGGGGGGGGGDWLGTVLGSHVTVALLANLAAHVFLVLILSLKVSNRSIGNGMGVGIVAAQGHAVIRLDCAVWGKKNFCRLTTCQ